LADYDTGFSKGSMKRLELAELIDYFFNNKKVSFFSSLNHEIFWKFTRISDYQEHYMNCMPIASINNPVSLAIK
jgi:hypothetical protein